MNTEVTPGSPTTCQQQGATVIFYWFKISFPLSTAIVIKCNFVVIFTVQKVRVRSQPPGFLTRGEGGACAFLSRNRELEEVTLFGWNQFWETGTCTKCIQHPALKWVKQISKLYGVSAELNNFLHISCVWKEVGIASTGLTVFAQMRQCSERTCDLYTCKILFPFSFTPQANSHVPTSRW